VDGDGDLDILERGSTIGRYLIVERLGAGAMGVVYAAYDPELDRKVAIKLLRHQAGSGDNARRQARLVREAKAIAKLSHQNVVGIFDVGVHEGQVFLAMEYLSGGTLSAWLKEKRPWRQVIKLFIEVGRGLAAAHAEGLIHRDFKPDNVLLDRGGNPKVVDFGLVRLTTGVDLENSEADGLEATLRDSPRPLSLAGASPDALTRTGAMAGTPAYMAPEQFLGKTVDARSDQFAFCVALYEALYGERPFAGETVFSLADAVTSERLRPPPKNTEIPGWVRAVLLRGLRVAPDARHAGFAELLGALSNDPVARRNRRLLAVGVASVVVATLIIAVRQTTSHRREAAAAANRHLQQARAALEEGRRFDLKAVTLRVRALEAFDSAQPAAGEKLWEEVQAAERDEEKALRSGAAELVSARAFHSVAPTASLADEVTTALVALLERRGQEKDVQTLLASVPDKNLAETLRARLVRKTQIAFGTEPAGVTMTIRRYLSEPNGVRKLTVIPELRGAVATPVALELPPGSYLATAQMEGYADLVWPFVVSAGEKRNFNVGLMPITRVPPGFIYVPPGEFLFGSADESLRRSFLDTVPIHTLRTGGFFIARNETTFGDWLKFVSVLPPNDRTRYLPGANEPNAGKIALKETRNGWELMFQPWSTQFRVKSGQPLIYPGRTTFASHDWSRLPVTGIGIQEALEYLRWLGGNGFPGARLCDEREWERAARGADGRLYPNGDRLLPQDANFDEAFGKDPRLFGLEEVGLRVASASPFGVADMAGNAFEFARSFISPGEFVVRGGSYFQNANTTRSDNRALIDVTTKGQSIGLRVCLDAN
jgi:formylglycine-generating enzyme required for sulfatase activity/tRNA A-37 threonylcarbamoyl transferase component Bud32